MRILLLLSGTEIGSQTQLRESQIQLPYYFDENSAGIIIVKMDSNSYNFNGIFGNFGLH